jgi:L-rhamnonate dehydratase
MVDANQKFNLLQASELARHIEPYNISWFEEPVTHNYPPDMRVLRSRTTIPLAAGQAWGYAWQNLQFMEARVLDIAQTDVVNVGGFTEGIRVAHLAQAFDLPLASHGWPAINMHLIAATPAGYRVEFHAGQEELGKAIFVNPTAPEKGWVTCPDKPGLGLELNEDALKKYQDKG